VIQNQRNGAGFEILRFLLRDPPVQAAAYLGARIEAFRRNVPRLGHAQRRPLLKVALASGEWKRKCVHAERGRSVARPTGQSGVITDGAGGSEHYQGEVLPRIQKGGVVGDKLFGDACQFVILDRLWDAGKPATLPKAGEVVEQTEETMIEGAAQISRGGGEDKAGVMKRKIRIRLRYQPAI
jgi:hypothetical protein